MATSAAVRAELATLPKLENLTPLTQTWSIALDLPAETGLTLHAEVVGSEIHCMGDHTDLAPSIGN